MESSPNHDSAPTLEIGAIGVVDSRGHYVEHAAVALQKPRTLQSENEEPAVIVRLEQPAILAEQSRLIPVTGEPSRKTTDGVSPGMSNRRNTERPLFDEITAMRKAPRRGTGLNTLRVATVVETNRLTILILVVGIALLILAFRMHFR